MAVAKWRPAVISGARGKAMEAPARGVEAVERCGATRGAVLQAGGGRAGPPRRAAALHSGGAEKQSKQAGWRKEKGTSLQFPKIPGTQK